MVSQGKNNDLPDKDTLIRYLLGKLPPDEAHRIEKLILNDPLYQDALDGLETLSEEELEQDLNDLSQQIKAKTSLSAKSTAFSFYRVAAAIILLAVFSYIIVYTTSRMGEVSKNETLSQKKEQPDEREQAGAEVKEEETDNAFKSDEPETQKTETVVETRAKEGADQEMDISISDPLKEGSEERIDIVEEETVSTIALSEAKEAEPVEQMEESQNAPYIEESQNAPYIEESQNAPYEEESTEALSVVVSEESREDFSEAARTNEEKSIDIQDDEIENLITNQEAERAKISAEPAPVLSDYRDTTGGKIKETKKARRSDSQAAGIPEAADEPIAYSEIEAEDILNPVPADGYEIYAEYISENLNYPAEELEKKIEGRVKLRFIINKDSIPDKIRIVQSLSPDCDKEAKRLLREGPKWIPVYMDEELNEIELEYSIYFQVEK